MNSAEAVPYGPTGLCGCEGVECESVGVRVAHNEQMVHNLTIINYCKACTPSTKRMMPGGDKTIIHFQYTNAW